ncbi:MAG: AbrB family transcriptional regulator [Alkalibacterium sp.]|nr:AbrB family transcriptional regulator [Alkalibacterium sp.]
MRTYTTRKVGDEIVIDVPDHMGIEPDKEYICIKDGSDSFGFIPKEPNIFEKAYKKAYKKDINLRVEPEHEEDR